MLNNLALKLTNLIHSFIGKYKLSESDLDNISKKIRKILLEADVSLNTVKYITSNVKNKLIGLEINRKISPGKIMIKLLHDEFTDLMGGYTFQKIKINENSLNVFLFVGLQGVGKTTNTAKFANWIKKKYIKNVLLVSCDIYRPGAKEQLKILSEKIAVDFFDHNLNDVESILNSALHFAMCNSYGFLIVDSAGRLHIDSYMMKELSSISGILKPSYTFLVVDGIYGQDSVNSSLYFVQNVNISGFIVTKMDSDAKGGVILSLVHVAKKPIYFLSTGENSNDFEEFYANRFTTRLFGMGDVLGLIEDVKENLGSVKKNEVVDKFNLDVFGNQLKDLLKIGGFKKIMDKLPLQIIPHANNDKLDDKIIRSMLYIIDSMTKKERSYPNIINYSRKKRISKGCGRSIQDINKLLKYYEKVAKFSTKENFSKNVFEKLKIFNKF